MAEWRSKLIQIVFVAFSATLALACYLRPSAEDFDRFVYESLIRSRTQGSEEIYRIVKHESPRAEASSIMDSPAHLAQLGPLYTIRPLYIELTGIMARRLSPQKAINLVSAGSFFLIAIVTLLFTGRPLYSALFIMAPSFMILGRMGTPDALSTLMLSAVVLAVSRDRVLAGVLLLMISVWVRTDNVLFVVAMLGWMVWKHKLQPVYAAILGGLAASSVDYINVLSGNYGWKVLLHFSFVGGRYPAEITTGISLSQYVHAFIGNAEILLPQLAPFLLLGIVGWRLSSSADRTILVPVAIAAMAHFVLFPSPEARYLAWACLISGMVFVRSLQDRAKPVLLAQEYKAAAA